MREVNNYQTQWNGFRLCCEQRAKKANCCINNKGWQRLREFHLENYLKTVENPFGFLYLIKLRHRHIYSQIQCMPRLYSKYLRKRQIELDSPAKRMVKFPTWRGK